MNHHPPSLCVSLPIIDDDRDCPLPDNPRQPHLHSGRRLLQVRIQQPFWQVSQNVRHQDFD